MLFVDGENFTLRAQAFAKGVDLTLKRGPNHEPGVFVWMPTARPDTFWAYCGNPEERREWANELQRSGRRAHYYTSVVGPEARRDEIRAALWSLGFSPDVFRKDKATNRSKGVDVTLTKDVLSHAYQDNYDVAFIVAGDGDYVPLVQEVKRRGKIVYVAFFDGADFGLNPELRLAADRFFAIDTSFTATWVAHHQKNP